jgi:hypothetical protein
MVCSRRWTRSGQPFSERRHSKPQPCCGWRLGSCLRTETSCRRRLVAASGAQSAVPTRSHSEPAVGWPPHCQIKARALSASKAIGQATHKGRSRGRSGALQLFCRPCLGRCEKLKLNEPQDGNSTLVATPSSRAEAHRVWGIVVAVSTVVVLAAAAAALVVVVVVAVVAAAVVVVSAGPPP